MNLSSFQSRIRIVSVLIFIFASILIFKLFFVQIIHQNTYSLKADRQYATPASNVFDRGSIFFSKKDNSLVAAGTVSSGFKIAIKAKDIIDIEKTYESLDPYMELDHDAFVLKAKKVSDPYEEVAFHLTKEQANEIDSLKLPGISIFKDNWRFYPGGNLASHTLGFLAYKGDDKVGQYGLERFYDDTLSKPKDQAYVNFFAEVFSNIKDSIVSTKKQGDVVTTIEPSTQYTLETELGNAFNKWNADQAGGIIMNPQTGEIYAITGFPDFDLNKFGEVKNPSTYRNIMVEDVLEFGSVIKPLVMASALDAGVVKPETTYLDKGMVTVNKKDIYNFDKKGRGVVSMQTVLDQSLNTGMVFTENKLGHDKFRTYMKSYGIGEKTGIDLPNETSGLINNLESPRDIEYANASFGQGIALTPIEAVRAFSVIANGGNMVSPHLAKQIRYEDGTFEILEYPVTHSGIIKKETSDTISRMLVHVFESYDGGSHKMEHYSIASKTGTAQVAMENGKGYYTDRHTHSFFGYFPAYDPQFIVFMFLKNPKEVKYASQTLIPPFVNITKFLLNYYNVSPDR
jgi:cell division protein FtsI (penicillin-binding protein 3)/stage V sporulation protein D (sporulation-specific penicillin-binding protein)